MKKIRQAMLMMLMVTLGSWASAADVPLGAGDVVKITVFGNNDLTVETRISEAGSISFPLVGEVKVGGLSSNQAEKKIADLLDKGGFIRNPQVNLIVTDMQSQQVSVLGQVNKPGRYPVDGKRSLTDVLAMAGGMNEEAADTVILTHTSDGKTTKETIDMLGPGALRRSSQESRADGRRLGICRACTTLLYLRRSAEARLLQTGARHDGAASVVNRWRLESARYRARCAHQAA